MAVAALLLPRSVEEAVGLVREHGSGLTVMGGGTLVMAAVNEGRLFPRRVMSLARAGLDGVRVGAGQVEIGPGVTAARLTALGELPRLAEAAERLGGPALRTMATVGGNLFAPTPYGDLVVPLLAHDAEVDLVGVTGGRRLPLETFLAEQSTGIAGFGEVNELVTGLRVSRPRGRGAYLRMGRREANTPAVVAVAVEVVIGADGRCVEARIALGAAGPRAMRARGAEAALVGRPLDGAVIEEAAAAAMGECDPPTDALASGWYRRRMVGVQVRRALARVAAAG